MEADLQPFLQCGPQGLGRRIGPDLDLERRRAVLGQIIDRIAIAPTTRANNKFDPERIQLVWKV